MFPLLCCLWHTVLDRVPHNNGLHGFSGLPEAADSFTARLTAEIFWVFFTLLIVVRPYADRQRHDFRQLLAFCASAFIAPPRFCFCSLSWLTRSIGTHVFSCRNTDHERYLHCGFSDVMLPLSFDLSPCTDYRKQLPYLIAPIIFGSSAVLRRPAILRKARPATEPDVYWPSPKELK